LYAAKEKPFEHVGQVGIAVLIDSCTRHVGVLFRRTIESVGQLQLLDLAGHHCIQCESPSGEYTWMDVDIQPERQILVAQLCELVEEEYILRPDSNRQKIGYAFHYRGETFDPMSGIFVTTDGYGLTCATFVLALFASHGVELLHLASWEPRPDDTEWQAQVVASMERQRRRVDPKHVVFIRDEIGCCRFRPEEVAAAGTVDASSLPLGFREAESRGETIVNELFRRAHVDN
jgi:hypothetical protein